MTGAATTPPRPRCDGCGNEIDPDTCGCGESIGDRFEHDNHSPIPMGCDCYRAAPQVQPILNECECGRAHPDGFECVAGRWYT